MKNPIAVIRTGAVKATHCLGRLFHDVEKVDALYESLTPEARAAALKTFADILQFVAAFEAAEGAKGANFVLDENVVAIAKTLYVDATLDVQTASAVFDAFRVKVPEALDKPVLTGR